MNDDENYNNDVIDENYSDSDDDSFVPKKIVKKNKLQIEQNNGRKVFKKNN